MTQTVVGGRARENSRTAHATRNSSRTPGRLQGNPDRRIPAPLHYRTPGYQRLLRDQRVWARVGNRTVALAVVRRRSLWERMVDALRARVVA